MGWEWQKDGLQDSNNGNADSANKNINSILKF